MKIRRIPPFGRQLNAARMSGYAPEMLNVHLMVGARAWDRARLRAPPHVLVLPSDDSPESFDWQCVAGLTITVQGASEPDEDRLARLVICLLQARATHVCVLHMDGLLVRVSHFRPEILKHAA